MISGSNYSAASAAVQRKDATPGGGHLSPKPTTEAHRGAMVTSAQAQYDAALHFEADFVTGSTSGAPPSGGGGGGGEHALKPKPSAVAGAPCAPQALASSIARPPPPAVQRGRAARRPLESSREHWHAAEAPPPSRASSVMGTAAIAGVAFTGGVDSGSGSAATAAAAASSSGLHHLHRSAHVPDTRADDRRQHARDPDGDADDGAPLADPESPQHPQAAPPAHLHECVRPLLTIAVPIACTNFVRNASTFLTTYFIGNFLPRNEFAGVGAGLTFTNLTAISIGIGLSCALDTLCSQEFGRDPRSRKLGLHLQRGIVATLIVFFPVAIGYFFCEPLLLAVMDREVALVAARWVRLSIPITAAQLLTTCVQKYAQTQCEPKIPMYAATVGLVSLPPALYACRDNGVEGVAFALGVNRWFMLATVCIFVFTNEKLRHNFGQISWEALDAVHLRQYFRIGVPSMLAFVADFWAFEVMVVIAAHLGPVEIGAWVVLMNIYSLFFGPSIGTSAAACVKVGNALGAGDGPLARNMMHASLLVAAALAASESLLIFFLGRQIFELLTVDAEIVEAGSSIMHIAAMTFAVDVFFYVCQGIYRGCKRQTLSAVIVCGSMWGVGVPAAFYFAVKRKLGIMGLVLGLTAGVSTATPIFIFYMLRCIDYNRLAKVAARKPLHSTAAPSPPPPAPTADRSESPALCHHNHQQPQQPTEFTPHLSYSRSYTSSPVPGASRAGFGEPNAEILHTVGENEEEVAEEEKTLTTHRRAARPLRASDAAALHSP